MYCNACGAQNDDTAAACFRCGAALQTLTAQPQPPDQPVTDNFQTPAPFQQPYQQPYQMASTPNIPDNLVMAILSLVICGCLPLGVMAIVNATQVKSKLAMGDIEGAMKASENAKKFAIASWAAGIFCCGAYVILNILSALLGS
jgi:uncharacterized membrane protein YvbJ